MIPLLAARAALNMFAIGARNKTRAETGDLSPAPSPPRPHPPPPRPPLQLIVNGIVLQVQHGEIRGPAHRHPRRLEKVSDEWVQCWGLVCCAQEHFAEFFVG